METKPRHFSHPPRRTGGYLMLLALAFGAIFTTILGALTGYAVLRDKAANVAQSRSEAFYLADGGLTRYAWTLSNAPDAPFAGDAEVAIEATPSTQCGTTTSVIMRATGTPTDGNGVSASVSMLLVQQFAGDPCAGGEEASSTPATSLGWSYTNWRQE
jgi:hypothetical protein